MVRNLQENILALKSDQLVAGARGICSTVQHGYLPSWLRNRRKSRWSLCGTPFGFLYIKPSRSQAFSSAVTSDCRKMVDDSLTRGEDLEREKAILSQEKDDLITKHEIEANKHHRYKTGYARALAKIKALNEEMKSLKARMLYFIMPYISDRVHVQEDSLLVNSQVHASGVREGRRLAEAERK